MANSILCGNADRTALGGCRGLHAGNFWGCCHIPGRVLERCRARAITLVDHSFEPCSGCGLCRGGGGHHDYARGSGHRPLGAMALYAIDAIDANAADHGNEDPSFIPVDPIATVDDLVFSGANLHDVQCGDHERAAYGMTDLQCASLKRPRHLIMQRRQPRESTHHRWMHGGKKCSSMGQNHHQWPIAPR